MTSREPHRRSELSDGAAPASLSGELDASTAIKPPASGRTEEKAVPALTIVWHPVAHRAGERALLSQLTPRRSVALSRIEPDFVRPGAVLGEPLADPFVSRAALTISAVADDGVAIIAPAGGTKLTI